KEEVPEEEGKGEVVKVRPLRLDVGTSVGRGGPWPTVLVKPAAAAASEMKSVLPQAKEPQAPASQPSPSLHPPFPTVLAATETPETVLPVQTPTPVVKKARSLRKPKAAPTVEANPAATAVPAPAPTTTPEAEAASTPVAEIPPAAQAAPVEPPATEEAPVMPTEALAVGD